MPTNNKTPKLGLNAWLGTDKPMRIDYVNDNTILDNLLGSHLENDNIHLSAQQKDKLDAPFTTGNYAGNGADTQTIYLPFEPKMVLVFLRNEPFTKYDSAQNYTLCNSGAACIYQTISINSIGVSISGQTFKVSQTQGSATNNVFINLNKLSSQYMYIAFK